MKKCVRCLNVRRSADCNNFLAKPNFVSINRRVARGTVLGPFLFSLMVNDIKVKHPQTNNLTKFADDLTVSAPVTSHGVSALDEITNIESWASTNRMTLNLKKTWEMLLCSRSHAIPPPPVNRIQRKKWLKLFGFTFQENPRCWDRQVDELLSKAGSRIYILRVCKFYGYSRNELTKLFDSLILSLFYYAISKYGDLHCKGNILIKLTSFSIVHSDSDTLKTDI